MQRWTEPVWQLSEHLRHPFGPRLSACIKIKRWQVAAALSAAVTTTKLIGDAPSLRRNQRCRSCFRHTPAALREKGSGEEELLSEKLPPPQNLPTRKSFQKSALPRKKISSEVLTEWEIKISI